MWPFSKKPDPSVARYAALQQRLEEQWPDINNASSERFYFARMSGAQMKALIEADRHRL
jgi:hypothetical protein